MIFHLSHKMLFLLVCWCISFGVLVCLVYFFSFRGHAWPCYAVANLLSMNPRTQPKALPRWDFFGILFVHDICVINFYQTTCG